DPRPYKAAYDSAAAQLERARASAQLARARDERAGTLLADKAISREEFDTRQAGRAQGEADVRAAEAALTTAELNLGFTEVRSATGTINLRAVVPNPDRVFTPGLYARVQLEGSAEFKAMLIDGKAIMTDQDRKYVYVVGPKDEASRKDVTLGGFADGLRIVQ